MATNLTGKEMIEEVFQELGIPADGKDGTVEHMKIVLFIGIVNEIFMNVVVNKQNDIPIMEKLRIIRLYLEKFTKYMQLKKERGIM